MPHHSTTTVSYKGEKIEIDDDILEMMNELWDSHIETFFCCRGDSEAMGYLAFDGVKQNVQIFHKAYQIVRKYARPPFLFETFQEHWVIRWFHLKMDTVEMNLGFVDTLAIHPIAYGGFVEFD